MIEGLHPITQALLGTLVTWGFTALGSAMVFILDVENKETSQKILDGMLGFAGGVMLAASYWSLLAPAIEIAEESELYGPNGRWSFVPAALGFTLGAMTLFGTEKVLPFVENYVVISLDEEHKKKKKDDDYNDEKYGKPTLGSTSSYRRVLLLVIAITLHNLPEGMAVGVGFGSVGYSSNASFGNAVNLAIGIGLQNFPEEENREKDPDAAAAFYNQLQRSAQSDRADSLLFHMRALNNWVKSVLINEYSGREGDRVLDLACGKGGDLMKWTKRNLTMYVGVDIAQKSLEDAVERYTSFSRGGRGGGNRDRKKTEVKFIQGDLGVADLLRDTMHCWSEHEGWHDAVPLEGSAVGNFNIVSVQFSFHYMFGDAERANRFFSTVHELLTDGGVVIATTVDPNKLLMKYYQGLRPPGKENEDQAMNKPDVSIVDEKKREVCCIRFDAATRTQLSGPNAASKGSFGLRYNFTLRDRVEDDGDGGGSQAVDLPEYLVPNDLVAELLREHGFELLLKQNFHHFIQQRKDQDRNHSLLEKMHVTNIRGSISDAEWEVAGLYQVLAFKKSY